MCECSKKSTTNVDRPPFLNRKSVVCQVSLLLMMVLVLLFLYSSCSLMRPWLNIGSCCVVFSFSGRLINIHVFLLTRYYISSCDSFYPIVLFVSVVSLSVLQTPIHLVPQLFACLFLSMCFALSVLEVSTQMPNQYRYSAPLCDLVCPTCWSCFVVVLSFYWSLPSSRCR